MKSESNVFMNGSKVPPPKSFLSSVIIPYLVTSFEDPKTWFNTRLMTQNTKKSRRRALHERFKIWVMFWVHWFRIAGKSNQKKP